MRKNSAAIIIALAYIGATLAALNIALRLSDYFNIIIICYLAAVAISAVVLAIGFSHLRKTQAKKERQYLSQIMQSINAMVIVWDADFHFVEVNDKLTEITGYTAEDLLNPKALQKVLPPDAFAPSLQAIINNRDEEFNVTAKGGAKICTIWNTSLMSVVNEKRRTSYIMMSIGLDLSENVKMKEELIQYSKDLAASENKAQWNKPRIHQVHYICYPRTLRGCCRLYKGKPFLHHQLLRCCKGYRNGRYPCGRTRRKCPERR